MAGVVPTRKINLFQATDVAARVANTADYSGLNAIGNTLLQRGIEEEVAKSEEQGILDQQQTGGDNRLEKKEGFIGGTRAKAYNRGARLAFGIHKSQQIKDTAFKLYQDNKENVDAFSKAWHQPENQKDMMDNIHTRDIPTFQKIMNQSADGYLDKIRVNVAKKERTDQLQIITDESHAIRTELSLDAEQNGLISDTNIGIREAFYTSARKADVAVGTLAAWRVADDVAIRHSSVIHGFKNADDKNAYYKQLITADGTLGDLSIDERKQARSVLTEFMQGQKAQRTAQVSMLREQLTDSIGIETGGRKARGASDLLRSAAQYPELANKIGDLAIAINNRQELSNRGKVPTAVLEAGMAKDRIDIANTGGDTAQSAALDEASQKLLDENKKAEDNNDMLGLAMRRGTIQLQPANPDGSLSDPQNRMESVAIARGYMGKKVGLFTAEEITSFQKTWNEGSADDKHNLIGNLTAHTPREELGGVLKLLSENEPQLGFLAAAAASRNPRMIAMVPEIINGLDILENNPETVKNPQLVLGEIKSIIAPFIPLDKRGTTLDMLGESALGLYVQQMKQNGKLGKDKSTKSVKAAVAEILGLEGGSYKIKGKPVIPFEPFMPRKAMRQVWETITMEQLVEMNGGNVALDMAGATSREIDIEEIQDKGFLVYTGPGKYAIGMPSPDGSTVYLKQKTGKPFIFDYNNLKKKSDELAGGTKDDVLASMEQSFTFGNGDEADIDSLSNQYLEAKTDGISETSMFDDAVGFLDRFVANTIDTVDSLVNPITIVKDGIQSLSDAIDESAATTAYLKEGEFTEAAKSSGMMAIAVLSVLPNGKAFMKALKSIAKETGLTGHHVLIRFMDLPSKSNPHIKIREINDPHLRTQEMMDAHLRDIDIRVAVEKSKYRVIKEVSNSTSDHITKIIKELKNVKGGTIEVTRKAYKVMSPKTKELLEARVIRGKMYYILRKKNYKAFEAQYKKAVDKYGINAMRTKTPSHNRPTNTLDRLTELDQKPTLTAAERIEKDLIFEDYRIR